MAPDLTRRQVLSAGAITAIAAALDSLAPAAAARARPVAQAKALAPRDIQQKPWNLAPPYTLTSDVNMSQDYFLSADILINEGDQVLPVIRSDGSLVVVVVSGNAVWLARPDTTAQTGWTYTTVDNALASIGQCAAVPTVQDNGQPGIMLVYTAFDAAADGTAFYYANIDENFHLAAGGELTAAPGATPGVPQGGVLPDGTSAFATYWYLPSGQPINLAIETYTASNQNLNLQNGTLGGSAARPQQLVAVPVDTSVDGMGVIGMSMTTNGDTYLVGDTDQLTGPEGNQTFASALLAPPIPSPVPGDPTVAGAFLWADPTGVPYVGGVVVDGPDGSGAITNGPYPLLSYGKDGAVQLGAQGTLTSASQAAWYVSDLSTGEITVFLVGKNGALYMQRVVLGTGTVKPPVPIAGDVSAVYAAAQAPTEDTNLAIVQGGVLANLHRKGRTGAWRLKPMKQTHPTNQELDTYRTLLTVRDKNGNGVPGVPVKITPQFDVSVWQPTGSVELTEGKATVFTTDEFGQLCLASPTTDLYSPTLTVEFDNRNGQNVTYTVTPDGELHGFLAGSGSLSGIGQLNGTALQNATDRASTSSGTPPPTFPVLASNSSAAAAVATGVTNAMKAGKDPKNKNASQAGTLSGLDGKSPITYTPASPGTLLTLPGGPQSLFSWWDDIKDDLESAWQAVESGVAAVSKVVMDVVQDAEGAWHWAVQLAIKIGDEIVSTINYVITDLRTAAIAVAGIFQAVANDIADAIKWLRMAISGLFKDAGALGDLIYGWLVQDGFSALATGLTTFKTDVNNAFHGLEDDVRALMTGPAKPTYTGKSLAGMQPSPPANQTETSKINTNVKSNWLLNKTKDTTTVPRAQGSATSSSFGKALNTATKNNPTAQHFSDSLETRFEDLWDSVKDPNSAGETTMDALINVLLAVLDDALVLIDDLIDDVIDLVASLLRDLKTALEFPLGDIPILGELLTFIGVGNLSAGKLMCYILGFFMVIGGYLAYGDGFSLIPGSSGALPGGSASTWEPLLSVGEVVGNFFKGGLNAVIGIITLGGETQTPDFLILLSSMLAYGVGFFGYPFSDTSGGNLSFTPQSMPSGGWLGEQTPVLSWILGYTPYLVNFGGETADGINLDQEVAPLVLCEMGIGSLMLDCNVAFDGGGNTEDKITSIVGWIPSVLAPLSLPPVSEATDTISKIILAVLRALCPIVDAFVDLGEL